MAFLVGQNQVGAFTVPVNDTTADADQVRGNDNTLRVAFNAHDADPRIHLQQGAAAERPAAGSAGRIWFATDDLKFSFDNGSAWQDAAYAPATNPVFTGDVEASAINGPTTLVLKTGGSAWWTLDGSGNLLGSGTAAVVNQSGAFQCATMQMFQGGTVSVSGSTITALNSLNITTNASNGMVVRAGGALQLGSGGVDRWHIDSTTGRLQPVGAYDIGAVGNPVADIHLSGGVGFYGTAPIAKPTVTGSRGGNAALASLLTALANMGLLTNSSSA